MGKASRTKRLSAREKVAIEREAARRAQRRNQLFITGGSILGVIVIVVAMILVKTLGSSSPSSSSSGPTGTALPASVAQQITSVPASTLDSVGAGSVPTSSLSQVAVAGSGSALTSQGKPEMLYIGAEFCPYCAAMRWPMAVALSRFGTLSTPLHGILSSASDAYPNTATLTFYKTGFTSKYLTFTPVENEKVDKSPLQSVTPAQHALWQKYDANSYPFIDIGGKFVVTVTYSPQVLAGKTWSQISSAMHNPSSPVAQAVNGSANYLTAAICRTTSNAPASVCQSPAIVKLQGHL